MFQRRSVSWHTKTRTLNRPLSKVSGELVMGITQLSKTKVTSKQEKVMKFLLMGPAGAGKSTFGSCIECIVEKTHLNSSSVYIPTPGVAFYKVPLNNGKCYVNWELGGQQRYQPLWKLWWRGATGAFLIIDSSKEESLTAAKNIHQLIVGELGLPYVVCINKQDLPNALPPKMIASHLEINDPTIIFPTSAVTGENVKEAFLELVQRTEREA
jgi:signal recognition particle receptor subunit beta